MASLPPTAFDRAVNAVRDYRGTAEQAADLRAAVNGRLAELDELDVRVAEWRRVLGLDDPR